jgi:hypothetical protein
MAWIISECVCLDRAELLDRNRFGIYPNDFRDLAIDCTFEAPDAVTGRSKSVVLADADSESAWRISTMRSTDESLRSTSPPSSYTPSIAHRRRSSTRRCPTDGTWSPMAPVKLLEACRIPASLPPT